MDRTNQPRQKFSWPITISVTLDGAPLLANRVERLAHRQYNIGFSKETVPAEWQAVDSSTIETYISGCISIEEFDKFIALSYASCFSFTCTRALGGNSRLSWVNSLS
jgi:hypothetical protein